MKHPIASLMLASLLVIASNTTAHAGAIERACLSADRDQASRGLCDCIEDAARPMFSLSERRRIAKFFGDPHLSQELRQSDRPSDERLWNQYKAWGEAARQRCG